MWALEIKWSDRYVTYPEELKSIIKFCQENKLTQALVTTITHQAVIHHEGITINFIPASAYAYVVGANTLKKTKD